MPLSMTVSIAATPVAGLEVWLDNGGREQEEP